MTSCFVIKKNVTGTLYSINNTKNTPCVIAFKSKNKAKQMIKFIDQFEKNKQKLILNKMECKELIEKCSINSLHVYIYEENIIYIPINEPTDEIIIQLELNYNPY
jgi:hypothetical protein